MPENMMTQQEIYERVEEMIPGTLWAKFFHLSFLEMSEVSELADYKAMLIQAEIDWYV